MNSKLFIFLLCLLFSTFQAIYFYQIQLAPFPLVAFMLLLIQNGKSNLTSKEILFVISFLLIFLLSISIGIYNKISSCCFNIYIPQLIGYLLFPISIIYFRKSFLNFDIKQLKKIISIILIFHVGLFLVQYFLFILLNYRIDYLYSITGEEQRVGSATLNEFSSGLIRAAGLYAEPGSYSVYIYILISIQFLLKKKIDLLILIGLITMCLSYSMTGILMAFLFFLFNLTLAKNTKAKIKYLAFTVIGLFIFLYLNQEIFLGPITDRLLNLSDDGSAAARFNGGYTYFISQGLLFIGTGVGVLNDDIQAVSVIMSGLFSFGLILLSVFLILQLTYIYNWSKNYRNIIYLLPVLLSNISFNQIIYTMFFAFLTINLVELKKQ